MKRLESLIKGKCPSCGKGHAFEKPFSLVGFRMPLMNKTCEHCGHVFEKESGFFWGAMFVSYALTVFECIILFCAWQLFSDQTFGDGLILVISIAMLVLFRFNFRYSRLIWMYIFTSASYDI